MRKNGLFRGQKVALSNGIYEVVHIKGDMVTLSKTRKPRWNQQQKHDWAVEILDQNSWEINQGDVEFFHAGHTTIAVASGECGVAKFMPNGSDHFDRVIGRAVALCRLCGIDLPSEIEED